MTTFDAIVLAGGEGRRFEGASKPDVEVDGRRMIDHVLDAVAGARRIAVVAPPEFDVGREDPRIVQTMEDPPLGGPAAGVAAGLAALDGAASAQDAGNPDDAGAQDGPPTNGPAGAGTDSAGSAAIDVPVVVLSCDIPRVGPAVPRLLGALDALDAATGAATGDRATGTTPTTPGTTPTTPSTTPTTPSPTPTTPGTTPTTPSASPADGVALATWEAPPSTRQVPAGPSSPEPSAGHARPEAMSGSPAGASLGATATRPQPDSPAGASLDATTTRPQPDSPAGRAGPARPMSLGSAARPNLQRLAAVYRRSALTAAIEAHGGAEGGLHGVSMRRFVGGLDLRPVAARGSEAQDIDSWADLALLDPTTSTEPTTSTDSTVATETR